MILQHTSPAKDVQVSPNHLYHHRERVRNINRQINNSSNNLHHPSRIQTELIKLAKPVNIVTVVPVILALISDGNLRRKRLLWPPAEMVTMSAWMPMIWLVPVVIHNVCQLEGMAAIITRNIVTNISIVIEKEIVRRKNVHPDLNHKVMFLQDPHGITTITI